MATTIFPQTDDVVTRTAWQSLHSTINRGDYKNANSDHDTNLLKYQEDGSGTVASGTAIVTHEELSLDAGIMYHVRGCLCMRKTAVDTTDDYMQAGVKIGSAMKAYIAAARRTQSDTTALDVQTLTGAGQVQIAQYRGTSNVAFFNRPIIWVDMIVTADEDGVVSWYYTKATDAHSTFYSADALSWLKATPIKG